MCRLSNGHRELRVRQLQLQIAKVKAVCQDQPPLTCTLYSRPFITHANTRSKPGKSCASTVSCVYLSCAD